MIIVIEPGSEAAKHLARAFASHRKERSVWSVLDTKISLQARGEYVAIKIGEGMWSPSLRTNS